MRTNFPKSAFRFASRTLEKLNALFLVTALSYESSPNSEPNRKDYPFESSASPERHRSTSPPVRFSPARLLRARFPPARPKSPDTSSSSEIPIYASRTSSSTLPLPSSSGSGDAQECIFMTLLLKIIFGRK